MSDTTLPVADQPDVSPTIRQVSAGQGFNLWLGCQVISVQGGRAELTVDLRPDLTQHHGFAHGGIVGTLADNACAWAAASISGDIVTSGYTLQFLAPATGTRLRAVGQVLKAGRRQVSVEAKVFAETDGAPPKLVAVALASIAPVG